MSDTKLTVSLILNDAAFSKQLQNVNKELKLSESQFKALSSSSDNFEKSLAGVQTKLANFSSQLSSQAQKIALYESEISQTKTVLKDLTEEYNKEAQKLTTLKQKYQEVSAAMGANSTEAKELDKEISDLEKSQEKLENKIISTDNRLKTLGTGLNNTQTEFNQLQQKVEQTQTALNNFNIAKVTKQIEDVSEKLKANGEKIRNFGEGLKGAGETMSTHLTLPIMGVATAAAKTSIDFERSMSYVKATAGVTAGELKQLEVKSREMGAATSKSATDAADAMGYMALAGWDTKQMLEGIEPILRLSEAGQFDLATASSLVTDSMSGLKLQVKDLPMYLDQVAVTANKTNTDIQPLMEALVNVGSTAKTIGMPLEEINALLGVMANNGTKGYEAGTKLNSIITRMTAQSKPAAEAWDSIGVKVFDAQGKFKGMSVVLDEAKDKFLKLTDEEKMAFAKHTIGTDNVAMFTTLLNSAGGSIEDLTSKVKSSKGTLMEMATVMQQNVKGKIDEFKSRLEEAGLVMGETLLPIMSKVLDKLMAMFDAFNTLPKGLQQGIVEFGLFTAAIGPVLIGLGSLVNAVGAITSAGGWLVKTLGSIGVASATTAVETAAAGAAVGGLEAGAVGAAGAMSGVGAAVAAGALTFLPWVAGAVAVGAAGYGIYKVMTDNTLPAVDLFADTVDYTAKTVVGSSDYMANGYETNVTKMSEGTKTAVGAYMKLDDEATKAMMNVKINSDVFSEQAKATVVTKFTEMTNRVGSLNGDMKNKSITDFTNMVTSMGLLSDQNKTQLTTKYTEMVNAISGLSEQEKQKILGDFQQTLVQSTALTDQQRTTVVAKYQDMANQVKTVLDQRYTDETTTMQNFFTNSSALTATEEQRALEALNQNNANKKAAIDGYVQEINTIMQTAANEHRALTEGEQTQINEIQERMRANAVYSLSQNEIEAKVIMGRIKDYGVNVTKEQASEVIKNAEEQRVKSVDAANKQYEETKSAIEYMRDTTHSITADQANKLIADAERQRSESVAKAGELKQGVIDKITSMNSSVVDDVDTSTGKIMSKWDKVCRWWNGLWFNKKTLEADLVENHISTERKIGGYIPESVAPQYAGVQGFTDSLEVPNVSSYANQTVTAITASKSGSASNADILESMNISLKETQKQNDILMQLVTLMQQEKNVDVNFNVDGKNFAKATARYMKSEIDNIGLRKARLGGAY